MLGKRSSPRCAATSGTRKPGRTPPAAATRSTRAGPGASRSGVGTGWRKEVRRAGGPGWIPVSNARSASASRRVGPAGIRPPPQPPLAIAPRTRTRTRGVPSGANTSPTLRPTTSERRRPVPRAREMIVWSRTFPAVARRIRRCSSVVSVVGERCGIAASGLHRFPRWERKSTGEAPRLPCKRCDPRADGLTALLDGSVFFRRHWCCIDNLDGVINRCWRSPPLSLGGSETTSQIMREPQRRRR